MVSVAGVNRCAYFCLKGARAAHSKIMTFSQRVPFVTFSKVISVQVLHYAVVSMCIFAMCQFASLDKLLIGFGFG